MKLWLVVVQDKETSGESDIGFSVVEGNRMAADSAAREFEQKMRDVGRCRCIARVRELERGKQYRGKQYRATSFIRTIR